MDSAVSAAESVKGMLKVVAPGGDRRLVLVCFLAGPDAWWDTAQRFLSEVSQTFGGRVAVACVFPERAPDLAHEFAVTCAVTLSLFVDGEEAARSVGEGGETMLRRIIERHSSALK
jgi:hypothetical protein